jgi:hypothetical protein
MVGEGEGEGDTLGEGEAVRVTVGEALRVPLPDGVGVGEAVSDPLEEEEAVEEEEAEEVEDADDVAEEDGVSVACRRRPELHTAAEQRERLSTTRSMTWWRGNNQTTRLAAEGYASSCRIDTSGPAPLPRPQSVAPSRRRRGARTEAAFCAFLAPPFSMEEMMRRMMAGRGDFVFSPARAFFFFRPRAHFSPLAHSFHAQAGAAAAATRAAAQRWRTLPKRCTFRPFAC